MFMGTKLGRILTYHKGLSPIKLHDPLMMWSDEITRQNESVISPVPQYLWPL